jgi:hypothetical protein
MADTLLALAPEHVGCLPGTPGTAAACRSTDAVICTIPYRLTTR